MRNVAAAAAFRVGANSIYSDAIAAEATPHRVFIEC
jgi:hypothetical protein